MSSKKRKPSAVGHHRSFCISFINPNRLRLMSFSLIKSKDKPGGDKYFTGLLKIRVIDTGEEGWTWSGAVNSNVLFTLSQI